MWQVTWRFNKLDRNDIVIANSPHVTGQHVCKRIVAVVRLGARSSVVVCVHVVADVASVCRRRTWLGLDQGDVFG